MSHEPKNTPGQNDVSTALGLLRDSLAEEEQRIRSEGASAMLASDYDIVTHLPIDPWRMSKGDWQEKWAEREAKISQRMENRSAKPPASPDLFPEAPTNTTSIKPE